MRKLLAANLARMKKTVLFWGTLLLEIAFALFRVWTSCQDKKTGYEITTDELLFSYILVTGLVMAVFISMFLGTEYHDGTIRNKFVAGHSRAAVYFANLAVVFIACLLFTAAYLITALLGGILVFGFPTMSASVLLTVFLGTLVTSAAFCALYTLIAMNCSHKATSAIVCVLLFFGLLCASTYLFAMLDAQPEHLVIDLVDGEMVSHMEPN
ncbi:MAG: ABC transporter permease, partial [Oscillospiraceae bacterium]|nr:ABC transporter permease [Oscillospiraceae bacterium]